MRETIPILRKFPDFPRIEVGQASYTDEQVDLFLSTMIGMYYSPSIEKIHGVVQRISTTPMNLSESKNRSIDFMIYSLAITFANVFGLAMPGGNLVRPEYKIYPRDKFGEAVKQAEHWKKTDYPTRHAATIGSYDPPHLFHFLNMRVAWTRASRLIVGIDPNWLLSERKSKIGDERPRFPELFTRMWNIACSPMVDMVFELPVEPGQQIKEVLPSVWSNLGITLLATESSHEYLKQYREQMKAQGGDVLTSKDYPWWGRFLQIRSTSNIQRLQYIDYGKQTGIEKWRDIYQKREVKIARIMKNRWG